MEQINTHFKLIMRKGAWRNIMLFSLFIWLPSSVRAQYLDLPIKIDGTSYSSYISYYWWEYNHSDPEERFGTFSTDYISKTLSPILRGYSYDNELGYYLTEFNIRNVLCDDNDRISQQYTREEYVNHMMENFSVEYPYMSQWNVYGDMICADYSGDQMETFSYFGCSEFTDYENLAYNCLRYKDEYAEYADDPENMPFLAFGYWFEQTYIVAVNPGQIIMKYGDLPSDWWDYEHIVTDMIVTGEANELQYWGVASAGYTVAKYAADGASMVCMGDVQSNEEKWKRLYREAMEAAAREHYGEAWDWDVAFYDTYSSDPEGPSVVEAFRNASTIEFPEPLYKLSSYGDVQDCDDYVKSDATTCIVPATLRTTEIPSITSGNCLENVTTLSFRDPSSVYILGDLYNTKVRTLPKFSEFTNLKAVKYNALDGLNINMGNMDLRGKIIGYRPFGTITSGRVDIDETTRIGGFDEEDLIKGEDEDGFYLIRFNIDRKELYKNRIRLFTTYINKRELIENEKNLWI